jgi:hypothetical protein
VEETHAALAEAHQRIADLEAQVRLLNQKAAAAVDRWADYEDELSRLRAAQSPTALTQPSTVPSPLSPTGGRQPSPTRSSFLPAGAANRLSALLTPRKSTPNLRGGHTSPTPSTATTTEDLLEALNREQTLRVAAEGRLSATSREVEELSAALFEQANEMVAEERRARAMLEEKVVVLEKRDADKKRRLDRLELAVTRIQKVRALLDKDETPGQRPRSKVVDAPQAEEDLSSARERERIE